MKKNTKSETINTIPIDNTINNHNSFLKNAQLKNKLLLSFHDKEQNTIDSSNNMDINDKKIKNKFIFDFDNIKEQMKRNKKLSIIKNGIIYWLRKIYIIFQNKSIIVNRNKNLCFYFYYPIKDIDIIKNKFILIESKESKTEDELFCNNLEDIKTTVKDFLNIRKKSLLKINLYNENFTILKSDFQLMKKHDKYKIIYAKVIELSNIDAIFLKNINSTTKNSYFLLKTKISKNKLLDNPKKVYFSTPNIKLSNKIEKDKEKKIVVHTNIYKCKINRKDFNNLTNSIDKLVLDDMEGVYSFYNKKNKYFDTFSLTKMPKKYKIPIIKPKGVLNTQMYNIFNALNSKKANSFRHKLSLDIINSNYEYNKEHLKNNIINFKSYTNIRNSNLNNQNNVFNTYIINHEFMNNFRYNIINNNLDRKSIFENIKCNQYTSKYETYQIIFIALNDIIRDFISEKLDNYISDEEIKSLFDIETIIINLTNLDVDMSINIYLKEFLLYLYISNYINLNNTDFCFCLEKIIQNNDYIKLNNILKINSYKKLIYDVKNMIQALINNKNIFKEKIKENYDKNEKIILIPTFILFLAYNRNNLHTEFYKDTITDSLNAIDILIDINNINDGFDINQYIKFRLYLTKNELINDSMKKEFIFNFFNKTVYKNKNFDKTKCMIELRPILKNIDSISKILNNKDLNSSEINEVYDKFVDYFNF